nr:MAG TPA: hypothetical protein [Caudoviricetes sp.]
MRRETNKMTTYEKELFVLLSIMAAIIIANIIVIM